MPPKKTEKPKKTPAEQKTPAGVNIYHALANHLSTVTGHIDPKTKEMLMASAPVQVGGSDEGEPMIRVPGVISSRCETLDAAIGVGGFPMSRLSIITGGEGCGKTTICGLACAEVQQMVRFCSGCNEEHGGIPIYVDNEFKLDLDYFKMLGVDISKILVTSPATVEDSFTIMNELIQMVLAKHPGIPILAVLDSLNATKSEKEYEVDGTADFTEANQGGLGASARFMSTNIPKLLRLCHQKPVALLFVSQPRDNIGTPGRNLIAGGNAPKFYAALAIELWRKGFWEESGRKIGSMTTAKVFKNQVAKPFQEVDIGLRWGIGIDYQKSLLDQAVKMALINVGSGAWYEMPSDDPKHPIKWQGMKGWHALTQERPELVAYLKQLVREPFAKFQLGAATP